MKWQAEALFPFGEYKTKSVVMAILLEIHDEVNPLSITRMVTEDQLARQLLYEFGLYAIDKYKSGEEWRV
jgi:hypothetical protein